MDTKLITMETLPSIDTVLQALHALYHNPDVSGKEKASVWLGELQRSVYAWSVSDQLLQLDKDTESSYFAAQTMRTKIQFCFSELPSSSYFSLRDSLIDHISNANPETNQAIVTQLCLALADLVLQLPSWHGAAQELIQRFGTSERHLPSLLEILTVLPEEVNSRSLRLGANRRTEITAELMQASPAVMALLSSCVEKPGASISLLTRVYKCLASWVNLGAINSQEIASSELLLKAFHSLAAPEIPSSLHEAITDCFCAMLVLIEDLGTHAALAQSLFQGIYHLPEAYNHALQSEDLDRCINLCRIFTELAESLLDIMINTPNQGLGDLRTLDLLLLCLDHPQFEVAEITFNFWYRLSETLYSRHKEDLSLHFVPYIQRLLSNLWKHCRMETDADGILDDADEFGDFRLRVSEVIKDVVFLVGALQVFQSMYDHIVARQGVTGSTWDEAEAALFVMSAVAKSLHPQQDQVVPSVLQSILQLPDNTHVAVLHTSTILIGELSDWIDLHPDLLEPVLQFLLKRLQHQNQMKLAGAAAEALQKICSTCSEHMGNHFTGLLSITQAMDSFQLKNDAAVNILKGTAVILSKMPLQQITNGLRDLCSFQTTPLRELLEASEQSTNEDGSVKVGSKSDPVVWLDRLAAIFRHVTPSVKPGQTHPCQVVVMDVWPVLSQACAKFQGDSRLIERCCRCIRFAIRCVGKSSAPLLQPLVSQMVSIYQMYQHSCFLYLGSILVDEYGSEVGCVDGLIQMLEAFLGPTFKILQGTTDSSSPTPGSFYIGLREHPDTVDDLFRLCTRFLQRCPVPFLQNTFLETLLGVALHAAQLDHRDANASVMKFLTELIRCGSAEAEKIGENEAEASKAMINGLLIERGEATNILRSLLQSSIYYLPSYMCVDVSEVIYELLNLARPAVCVALESVLQSLPTFSSVGVTPTSPPPETATPVVTQEQLSEFHKQVVESDSAKNVQCALREFTRLFR